MIGWSAGRVLLVALMASVALHAQAPASRTIWALEAPDRIVEHDAATFAARRTVPAPRRVLEHPEYLRANSHRQFLFTGEHGMAFAGGDMAVMADRV